jgi:glyoxylase-like metal-dependent hydrolase (beta-lactamase superfamily II)
VAGVAGVIVCAVALQAQQPRLSPAEQSILSRSMEQPQPSAYPVPMPPDVTLEVLPVLGNVFLIAGGPSNVTVQVGEEGVFVVDTATPAISDQVLKAIRVLSSRPISYIVNTGFDPEHFGGNELIAAAGQNPTVAAQALAGAGSRVLQPVGAVGAAPQRQQGAVIFGHENTLNRMSAPTGESAAVPFALWPTNTFFTAKKTVAFNGEPIEMVHAASAHTDGDLLVFFRHSNVVAAGDVINANTFAPFDPKRGGSIAGVLSALNDIIDIAVPTFNQQGGTRIVPGHGRILNEADVVEYRDMTTIIHDRVKLAVDKGMTLEQLLAQQPTLDYDGLYATPAMTGAMYVEAIYNELKPKAQAPAPARRRQ